MTNPMIQDEKPQACECPARKALAEIMECFDLGILAMMPNPRRATLSDGTMERFAIAAAALSTPCPCEQLRADMDRRTLADTSRINDNSTVAMLEHERTEEAETERDILRAELASAQAEINQLREFKASSICGAETMGKALSDAMDNEEKLEAENQSLRAELAASQERERKLREALKRVWRIATGEDQVAQDDTDAMGVIAAEARVVIAAALATPETKEKP